MLYLRGVWTSLYFVRSLPVFIVTLSLPQGEDLIFLFILRIEFANSKPIISLQLHFSSSKQLTLSWLNQFSGLDVRYLCSIEVFELCFSRLHKYLCAVLFYINTGSYFAWLINLLSPIALLVICVNYIPSFDYISSCLLYLWTCLTLKEPFCRQERSFITERFPILEVYFVNRDFLGILIVNHSNFCCDSLLCEDLRLFFPTPLMWTFPVPLRARLPLKLWFSPIPPSSILKSTGTCCARPSATNLISFLYHFQKKKKKKKKNNNNNNNNIMIIYYPLFNRHQLWFSPFNCFVPDQNVSRLSFCHYVSSIRV